MAKKQEKARPIREVAADTGLSRELIHHYLRQGLLPRSRGRAKYSGQQVRLLQLIKKLREDHQLPLEVIRSVFQFFDFDPARLEPLTLSHSLNTRMTQLGVGGEILSSETLSSDELIRRTGVSMERVTEYVEAKLVAPIAQGDEERFTVYDANIITLCERGLEIGIPFESFRTIASYTRIGFAMEHAVIFQVPPEVTENPKTFLGELFVRREITTSFIQNLLESLIAQRIQDMTLPGLETRATLDRVLYRPSPTFIRRHAVDERIDGAQEKISRSPDDMAMWLDTARLMLHAGRHREAVFFLEQAQNRWPLDPAIRELYGRALVCAAQYERAIPILEKAASISTGSAAAPSFLALALVAQASSTSEVQQIPNAVQIKSLARTALKAAGDEPPRPYFWHSATNHPRGEGHDAQTDVGQKVHPHLVRQHRLPGGRTFGQAAGSVRPRHSNLRRLVETRAQVPGERFPLLRAGPDGDGRHRRGPRHRRVSHGCPGRNAPGLHGNARTCAIQPGLPRPGRRGGPDHRRPPAGKPPVFRSDQLRVL
jgi:DNA-binding transcriptional MerR regulator